MRDLWQFSSSDRLEELTFNKVLERFYDFGIAGLVRENVQNSLDGKLQGSKEPVIVNIEIGTILLIYSYYDKILTNFEVLGTITADYQSFIVSLKRINKIISLS